MTTPDSPVESVAQDHTGGGSRAVDHERWPGPRSHFARAAILLAGLVACQFAVLGSSLWGATYLLPLDILGESGNYLPPPARGGGRPDPQDSLRSDLVYQMEPWRRFVVDEVRAGRLPLWNPYNYGGHPLLAANQPGVFSPYRLLDYLWPSPVAVAWGALLRAVVAGVGAYGFFRRATRVGWLPATVGGWCFPLTGTLVLSGGYPGAAVVSFLPWVLLAADAVARRPTRRATAALAAAVACALLAGHAAFAGQVLLAGGAYFVVRVVAVAAKRVPVRWVALRLLAGAVGVGGGFLLSAPQTLPTVEYLRSSYRIAMRQAGQVETPPSGPAGAVQMVLPFGFGSSQRAADYVGHGSNWIESPAGGYAGLLVALALTPLAFADPSRRRSAMLWAAGAVLAMSSALGIPGLERLFQVPPVSLLRNNRLVFVAGFAVLTLGVVGLDVLVRRPGRLRTKAGGRAVAVGAGLAVALGISCVMRAADPSGVVPAAVPWRGLLANPLAPLWPAAWESTAGARPADWFGLMYVNGTLWCAAAAAALVAASAAHARPVGPPRWASVLPVAVALAAVAEMTGWAAGVSVTTDPALYYPRLAWMDVVAARPGRICGVSCLPANVNLTHRVADVRGYDAADPAPIVQLIRLAQTPSAAQAGPPEAAIVQTLTVDPVAPTPAANLLGVRYYVGCGEPPAGVAAAGVATMGVRLAWRGEDYWVVENPTALPRATVPPAVWVVPDAAERLRLLASPGHDPAAVALLEAAPTPGDGAAVGSATIVEDLPGRVRVQVDLAKGGLVRLADAWDAGWRATYDGRPVEVVRVDHALRGVVVPAGRGVVEFRYEPASFRWGLALAGVAACGWIAAVAPVSRRARGTWL